MLTFIAANISLLLQFLYFKSGGLSFYDVIMARHGCCLYKSGKKNYFWNFGIIMYFLNTLYKQINEKKFMAIV